MHIQEAFKKCSLIEIKLDIIKEWFDVPIVNHRVKSNKITLMFNQDISKVDLKTILNIPSVESVKEDYDKLTLRLRCDRIQIV